MKTALRSLSEDYPAADHVEDRRTARQRRDGRVPARREAAVD